MVMGGHDLVNRKDPLSEPAQPIPRARGVELASASLEAVLAQLRVDRETGLRRAEVERRLRQEGPNEVPEPTAHPVRRFLGKFWGLSASMLELILLLSWVLHKYVDLAIVSGLLLVNAVVSVLQEGRASRAVEALRARLRVMARVRRDGAWQPAPARELVPGATSSASGPVTSSRRMCGSCRGIAVNRATDVAKGAASVVLVDEELVNIVALVEQGRVIYQRILTWIINKISRTLLKAGVVTVALLATGQFVVSPLGMILLVFLTDFAKIALATDRVEGSPQPERWALAGPGGGRRRARPPHDCGGPGAPGHRLARLRPRPGSGTAAHVQLPGPPLLRAVLGPVDSGASMGLDVPAQPAPARRAGRRCRARHGALDGGPTGIDAGVLGRDRHRARGRPGLRPRRERRRQGRADPRDAWEGVGSRRGRRGDPLIKEAEAVVRHAPCPVVVVRGGVAVP
jgi:hypothetical protein